MSTWRLSAKLVALFTRPSISAPLRRAQAGRRKQAQGGRFEGPFPGPQEQFGEQLMG